MVDRDNFPSVEPRQLGGEDVWFAEVIWVDGRSEHVGAFRTKAEAERWIADKSEAWLDEYERRRQEGSK
jgi:hypothetical protein